jgi:multiple sugar transport system substrate-binding protein
MGQKRGHLTRADLGATNGGGVTRRQFLLTTGSLVGVATIGRDRVARAAHKAKITYWTPLDPKSKNPRSAAELAMVDLFRKKYPEIEVEVQPVPWQVIGTQTIQSVAAGRGADVVQFSTYDLPIQVEAKTTSPLNEFMTKAWLGENQSDFLLPWENTVYDGQVMGLYWNSLLSSSLWYRQDLLEKKGLKVPKTWEEIVAVGAAVQTPQIAGYLTGLSKTGNAVQLTNWLIPAIWAAGSEFLAKDGQAVFNNPNGARPLDWLSDTVHKHKVTPSSIVSLTRDNVLDAFSAGTAAMVHCSSNIVSSARKSAVVGKVMGLVASPGPTAAKPAPAFVTGKTIGMTRVSREREAAWLFIEHMTGREAQLLNAKIAQEPPCRKSVIKDPWFDTPEATDLKIQVEYMARHPYPFRYHPKNNLLADWLAEGAQQIIANRRPALEVLNEVAKKWNGAIGLA